MQKVGFAERVIKLLFATIPLGISFVFFYAIFYGYRVRHLMFDPVRDVAILALALLFLIFAIKLINARWAAFCFFLFLGILGFLGLIAVAFFWEFDSGSHLFFVKRTLLLRELLFYLMMLFLGVGLLLVSWRWGKTLIIDGGYAFFLLFTTWEIYTGNML